MHLEQALAHGSRGSIPRKLPDAPLRANINLTQRNQVLSSSQSQHNVGTANGTIRGAGMPTWVPPPIFRKSSCRAVELGSGRCDPMGGAAPPTASRLRGNSQLEERKKLSDILPKTNRRPNYQWLHTGPFVQVLAGTTGHLSRTSRASLWRSVLRKGKEETRV